MSSRSYQDAISKLNSLQSNAATLEALRASGGRMSEFAIPEMLEYLHRIGYSPDELNKLNVIHVTGTKGKGSTCAFVDSILRHTTPSAKIGLYTSPHLVAVRERIRINGVPLSEEDFAKFFFEVWDRLEENDVRAHPSTSPKPMYFRYVTLMAFHAFLSLKVDATILEVGVGGRYDSTNIVPKPIVTGVSTLGIDHVAVLGKTLGEIAWQKAGIFKEGVPAFSVQQPEEGMEVLRRQAKDLKSSNFVEVPINPEVSAIKLGLPGEHQLHNASLAVELAHSFLTQAPESCFEPPQSNTPLPSTFVQGLSNARWPGRCQEVSDPSSPGTTWYLDGAHTMESLTCSATWYVSPQVGLKSAKHIRVLIFNCTNGRAGPAFLGTVLSTISSRVSKFKGDEESAHARQTGFFDHVIFCSNVTYADGGFKGDLTANSMSEADHHLAVQRDLAAAWMALVPSYASSRIHVLPSIEHAVKVVRSLETEDQAVDAFVTGSLHLVGGLIEVAGLASIALDS